MSDPMTTDTRELIHVNGRERRVPAGLTVAELLEHLDLDPRLVVVERNATILARERYATQPVTSGDRYELVHFVGGG